MENKVHSYTGWLMPDGQFYSCGKFGHRELLIELLQKKEYRYLMIEMGSLYGTPSGTVCFHDTDFKYASFEGEITEEVKQFLIGHYSEFNEEQRRCVLNKFRIQYGFEFAEETLHEKI